MTGKQINEQMKSQQAVCCLRRRAPPPGGSPQCRREPGKEHGTWASARLELGCWQTHIRPDEPENTEDIVSL